MKAKCVQKPFGMVDKIGYMFGDFGNDFTFILSSMFLMKFYTDVMGVDGAVVGLMMMLARFVDAFTDITMGQIVDRSKPGKRGKFLPWIRRMCGPVAVASLLMYATWFSGMSLVFKTVWMFVTYLLWGSVFYTGINIPYGSMASAISADPGERAELSKWRTVGASLASAVIGILVPLVVYYTDANGNKAISGTRMTLAAAACSAGAVLCYILCYRMTTERVKVKQKEEKFQMKELASLFKNRSLVAIIISTVAAVGAQTTLNGMSAYIYPNYFGNPTAQAVSTAAGIVLTLICAVFVVKLTDRFGRKEISAAAALFSSVILAVLTIMHTKNAWLFVLLYSLVYGGYGLFSLITWAMITDVIDDAEVKSGKREDGAIYSVYSFSRKLGQALSIGVYGLLLSLIGYQQETAFLPEVTDGIYYISCLQPLVCFLILAVTLRLLYPLGKDRVLKNAAYLAQKREMEEI